ncbi:ferredoxin--nitrite reductase [Haloferax volcanii]|uniref:Ferredoxin--nitrite reductase n=2 Tax=Haloferax volcanii TaxID=2246 RepID=A0A6C0UWV4_HALVO|nr:MULTISPECIES: ferredoxin--nitrite reductase [Haloferax]ELK49390.1 ferredoxin--nitrite reductase [Haloferax sp. BAB-2207]ELZ88359.1 ferredoxin--nitrite reductase [Haloferax alexandrinus JCM 10717]NLV03395.1 ferredoxin--nitrite reductase [Haloferax alexandrinus]QIB78861.1 ferredoxin--nitrite reductase [Haloferax alexandrinus]TVT96171.1 ferredoxin--nitrite reductase [Haloferax volcanii]
MPTDVERWKSEVYGNEIREHLLEFAEQGWDSIPEDERDAWFERFKWWGLYHQRNGQESYFMMRIGTPNGVLTPGQTEVVAEVADEYARGPAENPIFGNGYVDWTTRQSIQLHWIKLEDIPEIFDKLESVGLSTQQACGDSWRNIVGCPVAGKDKHEHVDALPVAMELNETFKGNDDHSNLPRKWKVSVTGCREGCGQGDINDLALEPATKEIDGEETKGFNIRIGGGLSRNEPRLARDIDVFVTPEQAPEVSGAISALFRDNGDRDNRYNARIKFLMDEWGPEKFRNVLQEEYVDFELETAGEDLRSEYSYNSGYADGGHSDHVGIHEQADGNYYVGLDVLVGRMGVDDTKELARVADEYGSGEIRITQRQNVIITDVPEEKLDALQNEDLLDHYSPDPHPFMRGSIACTGTEFCSLSIVETKNRQVRYARWLKENVDLPAGVEDFHIHLSGCTASCAQPQIADISLRGMKTRKDGEPVEALDIGLGGGLGENPNFAEWVTQRVPVDEVPGAIKNLLANFEERREGDETFREFVARTDEEELAELVEPEETSYEDPMMHNTKRTWYPYADDDGLDASPAPTRADGTPIASDD